MIRPHWSKIGRRAANHALAALAFLGFIGYLVATCGRSGITPDSLIYLSWVEHLLEHGFFASAPTTHYPPFFPTLLAFAAWLGGTSPVTAATMINALAFAATIWLVGRTLSVRDEIPPIVAVLAALLLATSAPGLSVYLMAWSEPTFILFGMLGLLALGRFADDPRRWGALLAAVPPMAAACLTRYPGISLVAAGAGGVVLLGRGNFFRRSALAAGFAAASVAPLFIWMFGGAAGGDGGVGARTVSLHRVGFNFLRSSYHALNFIIPLPPPPATYSRAIIEATPEWAFWLLPTLALAALVLAAWRLPAVPRAFRLVFEPRQAAPTPGFFRLALVFALGYPCFILLANALFDPGTLMNERILLPGLVAALPTAAYALTRAIREHASPAWRRKLINAAVLAVLPLTALSVARGLAFAHHAFSEGLGYHAREWTDSRVFAAIRETDGEVVFYSNAPGAIAALTGRAAAPLPPIWISANQRSESFEADMANMAATIANGRAMLAFFRNTYLWYAPSEAELVERLELRLVSADELGVLYQGTVTPESP